jgi:cyclohexa-1,5-dienecarbonyl-CoA hydratase
MTAFKFIKLETADGVARVFLDRPKHNVFNIEMMKEFNTALETLTQDNDLKAMVILGEGASWCAGVDVGDHKPEMAPEMIATFNRSFELINALKVPTVAAVHGACLGGGMEYAIACDIVIAARRASFGQPEVRLGFFPPYAAVRLPALIGPAKAIEVCTTGNIYSADEAYALGFVSRVVDDDDFSEAVEKTLKSFKASSPLILRLNKQAVVDNYGRDFATSMQNANDLFLTKLIRSEDTSEGIASFYEKRKPVWKNK